MSKKNALDHLDEGALMCCQNAERLTKDAWTLFYQERHLSAFLLSELSREEIAKGFRLLKWGSQGKTVSKEEWDALKRGKKAHISKLKDAQEADDEWLAGIAKASGLSYDEIEKGILSREPQARNMDEYRRLRSEEIYHLRLNATYVDYDFENREWISPLALGIVSDPIFSLRRLAETASLLQMLRASMRKKEGQV